MRTYRVGVLGCGQIAQIMHLPYLRDLPGWEIYALCDISAQVTHKVAEKYGIPAERCYTDYDAFLADPNMDVVLICSKDHCEPAVKAAEAGKHVFVEKPFGFNLRQARAMADAADRAGVKMMVGYMKCYDTGYQEMLRQIRKLKEIHLVRFHDFGGSFAYTRDVYDVLSGSDVDPQVFTEGKRVNDAAMLEEIGQEHKALQPAYSLLLGVFCHDAVLLRHAFGDDLEVLFADVHGSFTNALLQAGETRILLESGLVMTRPIWDEYMEVYSGEKNLRLDFPWPYLKNAPSRLHVSDNVPGTDMARESTISTSFQEAYRTEWQHFHECLEQDKQPMTNGRDAVKDIELMSRIIRRAAQGAKQ